MQAKQLRRGAPGCLGVLMFVEARCETVPPEEEMPVVVGMTYATPKAAVCLQGSWYRVTKESTCGTTTQQSESPASITQDHFSIGMTLAL